MRKMLVELKVKLIINANTDIELANIINELDYNFTDTTGKADILDMEILDYTITDSK